MRKMLILAFSLFSCANLNVDIGDVCVSNDFDLPGINLGATNSQLVGTVNASVDEDLSGPISDVNKVADVTVDVKTLTLTAKQGNFAFVQHVQVTALQNSTSLVVADADVHASTSTKSLSLTIKNNDELVKLLTNGKVSFDVELTGSVPQSNTPATLEACVSVSGSKSL